MSSTSAAASDSTGKSGVPTPAPAAHGHSASGRHPHQPVSTARARFRRHWVIVPLLIGAIVVGAWIGQRQLRFFLTHETTDDAYVDGHISPVLPRIAGNVIKLLVRDNEHVTAGQPLLRLDSRDYDLKVAAARATLLQAEADLTAKQSFVAIARASAGADAVSLQHTQADSARDAELVQRQVLSERDADTSRYNAALAAAKHALQLKGIEAAETQVALSRAAMAVRQTELDQALLQQSYATIAAPITGFISRRNVETGQYVQPGQPLLAIAAGDEPWIVANFKETQIKGMHPGQAVVIETDAYPGLEFHGRIDSLAAATGAKFALLPPDNAAGNFVKVTQRVPVKIVVDSPADPDHPLRLGLSVVASVVLDPPAR